MNSCRVLVAMGAHNGLKAELKNLRNFLEFSSKRLWHTAHFSSILDDAVTEWYVQVRFFVYLMRDLTDGAQIL